MTRIECTEAEARCLERDVLTSGMVGAKIKFEFDSAWTGLSKTAIFPVGSDKYSVVLENGLTPKAEIIPYKCFETAGHSVTVGVYGTKVVNGVSEIVIPTIYCDIGIVKVGTDTTGAEGSDPVTASILDQVLSATNAITGITADATSVSSSSSASATMTDVNGHKHIHINVPKGVDGANGTNGTNGEDGEDGFSPTVSVSTITGGHKVSITDAEGTEEFNVMDGATGAQGIAGVHVSNTAPSNTNLLWIDTTENGVGTGYVSFKMFGAVGNGTADDTPAIRDCVAYANEHNLPIVNLDGTYYCKILDTITLKTSVYNTDNVTFLLSDKYSNHYPLFQFVHDELPTGESSTAENVNLRSLFAYEENEYKINKLASAYANKFFVMDTKISYGKSRDASHGTEALPMYEPFYPSNDGCRLWAFDAVENRTVDLFAISSAIEHGYTWSGGTVKKRFYDSTLRHGACFLRVNRNNCTVRDVHIYCDRTDDGGNVIMLEECGNTLLENIKGFSKQPNSYGYEISAWRCADITARHITGANAWSCFCTRSVKNMNLADSQIRNFDVHWDAFGIFVVDCCQLAKEAHVGYGKGKLIVKNSKLEAVATREDFFVPFAGEFILEDCDIRGGARVLVYGYDDSTGQRSTDYFFPIRLPKITMRNCTCDRRAMYIRFEEAAVAYGYGKGKVHFSDMHLTYFTIPGSASTPILHEDIYDVTLTNCTYSDSALTSMLASGTVKSAMYETLGGD